MAFKNWFKKETDETPIKEYTLHTMSTGYLVDFDLKTWKVMEYNLYDYDGFISEEWVLKSGEEVRYLERTEEEGHVYWTLTESLSFDMVEEDVASDLLSGDAAPETITVEGEPFKYLESGAGVFKKSGEEPGVDFVSWSYIDESEERVLYITQWGERDFKLAGGYYVEEYQFTDILPASSS